MALLKFKFSVFVVTELEVDALVVLAFSTAKLAELPNSVVMFAEIIFAREEIRFVKFALVENRFVDEELVIVPLVALILESETLPAERVVIVAEVSVAFPAAISALEILVFAKLVVPVAFKFVVLSVPSCDV